MTIVQQFIDKNEALLDAQLMRSPEIGQALVEALALLNLYEQQESVTYTNDEIEGILNPQELKAPEISQADQTAMLKEMQAIEQKQKDLAPQIEADEKQFQQAVDKKRVDPNAVIIAKATEHQDKPLQIDAELEAIEKLLSEEDKKRLASLEQNGDIEFDEDILNFELDTDFDDLDDIDI